MQTALQQDDLIALSLQYWLCGDNDHVNIEQASTVQEGRHKVLYGLKMCIN